MEIKDYEAFLSGVFAFFLLYHLLRKLFPQPVSFIFLFPGVIFHELAHYFVGLLFNAKPKRIFLLPIKTKGGYTLGSVEFLNIRFYNSILTAMAPLILLSVPYFSFVEFSEHFLENDFFYLILLIYLSSVSLLSAMPSSTDFKVAIYPFNPFK